VTAYSKRSRPRAQTIAPRRLAGEVGLDDLEQRLLADADRPRTRGDCVGGARPCPFVSCRHHLYLDVNPATGSIKLNFPDLAPWDLVETCVLDVADRGGLVLDDVGEILNLTRERVRQLEVRALLRLNRQDLGSDDK
jgi:hypothetical protein